MNYGYYGYSAYPPPGLAEGASCTPAAGYPDTNCSGYARNGWFLPAAYVNNATCACSTTGTSRKDSSPGT